MRKIHQILSIFILLSLLIACGGEVNEQNPTLEIKKAELDSLKTVFSDLKAKIDILEDEVAELDPDIKSSAILIEAKKVSKQEFVHEVTLRGTVLSRKNVLISAEVNGVAELVKVSEGDKVRKGQLLIQFDTDVIKRNIDEVGSQLKLAKVVFEKQERLWKKRNWHRDSIPRS